jgi:hypothetical protein
MPVSVDELVLTPVPHAGTHAGIVADLRNGIASGAHAGIENSLRGRGKSPQLCDVRVLSFGWPLHGGVPPR